MLCIIKSSFLIISQTPHRRTFLSCNWQRHNNELLRWPPYAGFHYSYHTLIIKTTIPTSPPVQHSLIVSRLEVSFLVSWFNGWLTETNHMMPQLIQQQQQNDDSICLIGCVDSVDNYCIICFVSSANRANNVNESGLELSKHENITSVFYFLKREN